MRNGLAKGGGQEVGGGGSPDGSPDGSEGIDDEEANGRRYWLLKRESSAAHLHKSRARTGTEAMADCISDAGLGTFSCIFVEAWALNDEGSCLTRPTGGHWMDPAFAMSLPNYGLMEIAQELDVRADDVPPGVGLA